MSVLRSAFQFHRTVVPGSEERHQYKDELFVQPPATESRLMHGVGIRAMGKLMDRIMAQIDCKNRQAPEMVRSELAKVASRCRWTHGVWEELDSMPWNAFQNVPKHISLLSNYLIRTYLERRQNREA